ncbi:MAG: tetratricopeptide (TPR) repeat protein [Gammaproteobacteria bacterium]|jgi:tetratricopeptide (TPR) repeat protein
MLIALDRMMAAVVLIAVLATDTAHADVSLAQLFEQLREAPNDEQAAQVESTIWQRWVHHDNARVIEQFARGVHLLEQRDFPAAIEQFSLVLKIAPQFAEAWNKRATTYFLMDEFTASVADIERTLSLEPRHFGALSGLGLIFLSKGNLQKALASFEKVLAIYPRSASALFHVDQLRRIMQRNSI